MKWDYFSAVRRGLDSLGPDGEDRFEKTVAELAQRLGGDIEIGEALNGYSQGFHIVRDGEVLLRCLTRSRVRCGYLTISGGQYGVRGLSHLPGALPEAFSVAPGCL